MINVPRPSLFRPITRLSSAPPTPTPRPSDGAAPIDMAAPVSRQPCDFPSQEDGPSLINVTLTRWHLPSGPPFFFQGAFPTR